jgi:hypothetical protein
MNYVYAQTEQCKFWFDNSKIENYTYIDDFTSWTTQPSKKIALLELQYLDEDVVNFTKQCIEMGDRVVLFVPEFIDDQWCRHFDYPNVILFLAGKLNWELKFAQKAECMYFFWSTCDFYRTYPEILQIPQRQHQYFDVLLGRRKPHRTKIYNNIDREKNFVTYFPSNADGDIRNYTTENFVWPADVLPKPANEINFTVQEVLVDGVIVSLSQIVPRDIYSQTYYSLVAETQTENSFSFFTEKIVKPILARRLFIVASGQHYLQNLKNFGFKTFDTVIDESYDNEPDLDKRINLILAQVNYLSQQNPAKILEQITPIVEHNYQLMFARDWQQEMMTQIKNLM